MTKSKIRLTSVLLAASMSGLMGQALAQDVTIAQGFVTITQWRALPQNARMLYVLGVIDGMKFSPLLANGAAKTTKLVNCTSRMDGDQILAIAQKHLDAKPEQWHEAAHYHIFGAFSDACRLFK